MQFTDFAVVAIFGNYIEQKTYHSSGKKNVVFNLTDWEVGVILWAENGCSAKRHTLIVCQMSKTIQYRPKTQ
jgi:hypothetical protein